MTAHIHFVSAIQNLRSRTRTEGDIGQRLDGIKSQAEDAVAGIVFAKNNPSPTANAEANFVALQANAKKLETWRVKAIVTLNIIIKDAYGAAQTQLDAKINLKPDAKYEREIRDVYRSMSIEQRIVYLRTLAIKNKGPALAAVTEVDHELTGISDEMADSMRVLLYTTNAPDEYKAMNTVNELIDPVWTILGVVKNAVETFSDVYKLRNIEQAQILADAAQAKLNASLGA